MGSDDACVDIYSLASLDRGPQRVGYCKGIPSSITHIDWSQDCKYLQVSCQCTHVLSDVAHGPFSNEYGLHLVVFVYSISP